MSRRQSDTTVYVNCGPALENFKHGIVSHVFNRDGDMLNWQAVPMMLVKYGWDIGDVEAYDVDWFEEATSDSASWQHHCKVAQWLADGFSCEEIERVLDSRRCV